MTPETQTPTPAAASMVADHDYRSGGLRGKYTVTKNDGTPTDPNAVYFVLRVDADPHARKAVAAYVNSIQEENPGLANDLRALLAELDAQPPQDTNASVPETDDARFGVGDGDNSVVPDGAGYAELLEYTQFEKAYDDWGSGLLSDDAFCNDWLKEFGITTLTWDDSDARMLIINRIATETSCRLRTAALAKAAAPDAAGFARNGKGAEGGNLS